jgi:hypothetical protein
VDIVVVVFVAVDVDEGGGAENTFGEGLDIGV